MIRLGFCISICLTYPLLHFVARRAVLQLLFVSPQGTSLQRLLVTVGIVFSTLIVGLAVRKVEVIVGFTGAIASTALTFCLPAAIYIRIGSRAPSAWPVIFFTVGVLFMIIGVVTNLIALLE